MATVSQPHGKPVRVAIVGGGCAGMTAAWHLARQPGYEVHVYERSWRLGGKGASVRDRRGRILEHGLHVWLGFYENAFAMMRECYAEVEARGWGPDAGDGKRLAHAKFDDAFLPEPHIGVAGLDSAHDFNVWSGFLPPAKGLPGTPLDPDSNPFTLANYVGRCFALLKALMQSVVGPASGESPGEPRPDQRSDLDEAIQLDFSFNPARSPTALIERLAQLVRAGTLTTAAGLLQAVTILENWLHTLNYSPQVADSALQLMEAVAAQTRKLLRDVVAVDEQLRWKTEIIDIVMTIAFGLYRDRVLFEDRGLDAINNLDYRDWLLRHGATTSAVKSRFLTGIYDLVFAYRGGNRNRPALAAGVALRGALRMFFTYRGSMFWRMRSGMGDAVFAPLYKVLLQPDRKAKDPAGERARSQPVHFHFLHTLRSVDIATGEKESRHVRRIVFATEGDPTALDANGARALDDFGAWPDSARARFGEAMDSGTKRERTLEAGADFDAVIFALGFDDFVAACEAGDGDFFRHMPPEWGRMRRQVKTVATQSAQVWLDRDLAQLGWRRGSGIITALDMPFNTWADMTHTLATEAAWRRSGGHRDADADRARSVAYFCGVLPDTEVRRHGTRIDERVRENLDRLLSDAARVLWPNAFAGGGAVRAAQGDRYVSANHEGSERYTLSLPGTIDSRVSPLDCPVSNMTVAGDWTSCGLDAGCVEAAVMSGMLAAHAITDGDPRPESIVGYDHP